MSDLFGGQAVVKGIVDEWIAGEEMAWKDACKAPMGLEWFDVGVVKAPPTLADSAKAIKDALASLMIESNDKPEDRQRPTSDQAWFQLKACYSDVTDDSRQSVERHYAIAGVMLVTVEEWEQRHCLQPNDLVVSRDRYQEILIAAIDNQAQIQKLTEQRDKLQTDLATTDEQIANINAHCARIETAEYWIGGKKLADRARQLLGPMWRNGQHVIVALFDEIERLRTQIAEREAKDRRLYGPFPNARQRQERAVANLLSPSLPDPRLGGDRAR